MPRRSYNFSWIYNYIKTNIVIICLQRWYLNEQRDTDHRIVNNTL